MTDLLRPLALPLTPLEVLARWPAHEPLAALWSGGGGAGEGVGSGPEARWTLLARPSGWHTVRQREQGAWYPDGVMQGTPEHPGARGWPGQGWIGAISYDLARGFEPAVGGTRHAPDRSFPLALWARCEEGLLYDAQEGRWWGVGGLDGRFLGSARGDGYGLGAFERVEPGAYRGAVERVREYIRAGDCYQANLTHRATARFAGSARGAWARLLAAARPRYGVYLEQTLETEAGPRRYALLSQSPELFVSFDPATRRLVTRPMKGTRPLGGRAELEGSEKDAAELAMIVDLMRNDLGRVCEVGSVQVEAARAFEAHGAGRSGVLQTTATVAGRLRAEVLFTAALRSMLPAGSVTGCPKIRAMQVIDELEWCRRGPYCGSAGFLSDSGHAAFNVLIRTAVIEGAPGEGGWDRFEGATFDYHAGGGIVADSEAGREWEETLQKSAILGALVPGAVV